MILYQNHSLFLVRMKGFEPIRSYPQEPEVAQTSLVLTETRKFPKNFPKRRIIPSSAPVFSGFFYFSAKKVSLCQSLFPLPRGIFLARQLPRAGEASIYQPFSPGMTSLRFDATSRPATSFQFKPSFQRRRTAPYKIQPFSFLGEAFQKKRNRYYIIYIYYIILLR